jgi:hypothetical protein
MTSPADTPETQLAWEREHRRAAAAAAVGAAVFTLGGGIASALIYKDFPRVLIVDALRNALDGASPTAAGLKAPQVLFYDDNAPALLASAVALAVGALLIAWTLLYLYRATAARRTEVPALARVLAVAGPVLLAVGTIVQQVALTIDAGDFADSTVRSRAAVEDVIESGAVIAAALLRTLGGMLLAVALMLIALNAMRAGLLTRFMGILGVIVAVLFVLPIGSPLPVVQTFWLGALGVMFAGRWPNGLPPAWETGRAEPWPSQQELRERREQARGGDPPRPGDDEEGPPAAEPARSHPSSNKRKRKRRR